ERFCGLLSRLFIVIILFFFFQAEDGIRDKLVTEVQTCALPISADRPGRPSATRPPSRCRGAAGSATGCSSSEAGRSPGRGRHWRSEERRVGKECRSRWGGEQAKKRNKCEIVSGVSMTCDVVGSW